MRFLVLGPLEVKDGNDAAPRAVSGAKERTILACLLANAGRVVTVDDLVMQLWGDDVPRAPEKALASHVSRLRRALHVTRTPDATELIVFQGGGYSLDPAGQEVDAIAFERLSAEGHRLLQTHPTEADDALTRALALWRGDAYQGYRYTSFGAAEGERLDEIRRTAQEDLVEARLATGNVSQLVSQLESMVRQDPLRERRWGQLMVALFRDGRQAESLRAFARANDVLVSELGVSPGPQLQRLHAAVLAQDGSLLGASSTVERLRRPGDLCPYKGLARFETEDAELFFGREDAVAEAVGHVATSRFLAVLGSSGCGKSSVLRAGLLYALSKGALPGSSGWSYHIIRPGDHPLSALREVLDAPSARSVVVVDQFEEAFTACSDSVERTAFLDLLTQTALAPEGTTTVVIAMRADFYGRCAEHRALASLMAAHQILIGPMTHDELLRAIELPARRADLDVEEELSVALVADTSGQPGGLPLLSMALLELWTRRRGRTLRLADYLRTGGVQGAVSRAAEDAFAALDDAGRAAAHRILLRLASPGEGSTTLLRRRARLSEFDLDRDDDAARAMAALTQARLVTVDDGIAEVAHEALLHEWPRLRAWLEEDSEGRRLHRHVTMSAQTWDESGRDQADLYRGSRLLGASEWADLHEAELNDLEREYLRASSTAAQREAGRADRTNRRLRQLLAALALLLVGSLVLSGLALNQRNRATRALSLADAGRLASLSRLQPDPQLALLMAREAVAIDDSVETRSALFAALERTPTIIDRVEAPSAGVAPGAESGWIAISADGTLLATGGSGPTVDLFNAVSRQVAGQVDVGARSERAAFSPDGRMLAVVTSDRTIVAVDVASSTVRARVRAQRTVDAIAFDPNGRSVVTAEHDPTLHEYLVPRRVTTFTPSGAAVPIGGRDRAVFPQISRPLSAFAIAYTPDGALVTTREGGPTLVWNQRLGVVRRYAIGGQAVAVSPRGGVAALLQNDDQRLVGTVTFLNLRTGALQPGSGGHHGPFKTSYEAVGLAFTPDGRSLVTVGNDSRVLTWDVATGSVKATLAETGDVPLRGPVLSPNGTTAYTTDRSAAVVVWDLSGAHRLDRPFTAGQGSPQWPWFAMSSDGRLLAVVTAPAPSATGGGTIGLVDLRSGEVVRRIRYPHSTPEGLAFGPDARTLAVSDTSGPTVRLWDAGSGRLTATLRASPADGRLVALAISPDGHWLVGGGGPVHRGLVDLWDLRTPNMPATQFRTSATVEDVAFTPDGRSLVVATGWDDGGDIQIWDTRARRIVKTVRADDAGVLFARVSADGGTLITGGQTGSVRRWSLPSVAPVGAPLTGLRGFASSVDLSPDGRLAVGSDASGDVVLWDVASASRIGDALPGAPAGRPAASRFTPDGRHVVVVSDTGAGWVWDVAPTDWLTRACEVAGRSLRPQEWQSLLPDRPYEATCEAGTTTAIHS